MTFLDKVLKNPQVSNFMKIHLQGAEVFHVGGQTEGRMDGQTWHDEANSPFSQFFLTHLKDCVCVTGILIFIGLFITFSHANAVVKREIAKQSRRSLISLLMIVCNLLACILFIYYLFQDEKLYLRYLFMYLFVYVFFMALFFIVYLCNCFYLCINLIRGMG